MHDHDGNPKDNFVMSGKQVGGDDREESYGYHAEASSRPKSFLLAYHFERQSRLTPTRRPIGLVF